ncbi:hypothetical protein NM452_06770 [Vibrio metschnikovii]
MDVSTVNPQVVFDAYFNLPPFGKESKKHEFPDAFALEAIKQVSLARGYHYRTKVNPCKVRYAMKQRKWLIRCGQNGDGSRKEIGQCSFVIDRLLAL